MQLNMGNTDRVVRTVVGAIFFVLAVAVFAGALKYVAFLVGIVLLITAATSRCPAYSIFGFSTRRH